MAKDLEKINKVRAVNGLPPLEALPDDSRSADNPGKGSDPADVDRPPLDPNKVPPADPDKKPIPDPAPSTDLELSDDKLLELLQKKGITATSIEDLKQKPDPSLLAEKRDAAKLSYSLNKGLFTTREHENFIREKNNPKDLVFAQYHDEAKREDPELSDEDIVAEFEEKYGISADPGTRKFKRGEKEISLLAEKILRDRYGKIYDAESAFSKYETAENEKLARNQTIMSKAPMYKKDIEEVFKTLAKIKLPVSDTESYEVDVPEDALNAMKALFLEPDTAAEQILRGYTAEKIRDIAYTALVRENLGRIFHEGAKQYHLKRQAGSKGIPPVGPITRTPSRELTPQQKMVLTEHGINPDELPALQN